jgi:hypothetical protein
MPSAVVHAVAALTVGYRATDSTPDERAMSARALGNLIMAWLNPKGERLLGPVDYHYLEVAGAQMLRDPAYLAATGQSEAALAQSA